MLSLILIFSQKTPLYVPNISPGNSCQRSYIFVTSCFDPCNVVLHCRNLAEEEEEDLSNLIQHFSKLTTNTVCQQQYEHGVSLPHIFTGSPLHRQNRESGLKRSLSGKIQAIWKFCQNAGNLVFSSCKFPDSKYTCINCRNIFKLFTVRFATEIVTNF